MMPDAMRLTQVSENNLKQIDVEIPHGKHTVIAGVSGSGKSTLAYDVIYATAQRKLLDCMSERDSLFLRKMKQPKAGSIEGLSTVISLKQIKPNHNPRSTIGTYTSIGSYMRNLMALLGQCRCLCCDRSFPQCGLPALVKGLEALEAHTIVEVRFPYFFTGQSDREQQMEALRRRGYRDIEVNGERMSLRDLIQVDANAEFIMVVEGRFQINGRLKKSDVNCLKSAGRHGDKYISIELSGEDAGGIQSFYQKHGCQEHHFIAMTMEAADFSYNDLSCACQECMGSGIQKIVHPTKVIKDARKTLRQGPFFPDVYSMSHPYSYMSLYSLACHYHFSFDEPYEQLSEDAKDVIMYGSGEETFLLQRPEGYDKVLPNYLAKEGKAVRFQGILRRIEELYREMQNEPETPTPAQETFFKNYMHEIECASCKGTRLKKIKNYITLNGKSFAQIGKMEFSELSEFLGQIRGNEASEPIMDALRERLALMREIGLEYLSFERRIDTLSGGEYQRLRIANQIGSGLVGLTYIIDEPTDGLHGTDHEKVRNIIRRLLQKGNTVITIEHDCGMIGAADHVIELGPGAGIDGGRVIATGTPKQLKENPNSIIGKQLLGGTGLRTAAGAESFESSIKLFGVQANNLKNADIEIPLYQLTCFTGVSGSGKSTVVEDVLYQAFRAEVQHACVVPGNYRKIKGFEHVRQMILIDQSLPNGKNTSIPATYLDLFDRIRVLFSQSVGDDHEMKDQTAYFSFHSKGGCPACKGKGYLEQYIPYLGETKMICEECKGQQYAEEVLEVKYHGRNIKQVLDMTFSEALVFFADQPKIREKVELVCDLGLGYMQLGQPFSTLSGGEAQRMKLVKAMTRCRQKKDALFIFDEPSIGLHVKDIERLLEVMRRIVKAGNTVVTVEHHPDVILGADYLIDLGPGGGRHGGEVLFTGTPHKMLTVGESKTADYLREYVQGTEH